MMLPGAARPADFVYNRMGVLCVNCHDLLRFTLLSFFMRSWKEEHSQDSALCSPILHKSLVWTKFGLNLAVDSRREFRPAQQSPRWCVIVTGWWSLAPSSHMVELLALHSLPRHGSRFSSFDIRLNVTEIVNYKTFWLCGTLSSSVMCTDNGLLYPQTDKGMTYWTHFPMTCIRVELLWPGGGGGVMEVSLW